MPHINLQENDKGEMNCDIEGDCKQLTCLLGAMFIGNPDMAKITMDALMILITAGSITLNEEIKNETDGD